MMCKRNNRNLHLKDNHRPFMNELFKFFDLNSMDDWISISRKKIIKKGGRRLLLTYYSNDMKNLLSSVYPNYPWDFSKAPIPPIKYFESKENQREFLHSLFSKFGMSSLEDWMQISRKKLIQHGGKSLLFNYHQNDIKTLLTSVYPNFPWNVPLSSSNQRFGERRINTAPSIEEQREMIVELFHQLKAETLENFKVKLSKNALLKRRGGFALLSRYSNNISLLLQSLFPNYDWKNDTSDDHDNEDECSDDHHHHYTKRYFEDMKNQREFMHQLYEKLELRCVDDWLSISKSKIIAMGGTYLLAYYADDVESMLRNIYPTHHFDFDRLQKNSRGYFTIMANQRNFMNRLFVKLKMQRFEDWYEITKNKIVTNGGESLLLHYYCGDLVALFTTVYANFPWETNLFKLNTSRYFQSLKNQRKFMEGLAETLQLSSHADWWNVSKRKIIQHGGYGLLSFYNHDRKRMISAIFPELKTKEGERCGRAEFINSNEYFRSMSNQRLFMNDLFSRLLFTSFEDWYSLTRNRIVQNGGYSLLLYYYSNDLSLLLSSIYPNYPWVNHSLTLHSNRVKMMNSLFDHFKLNTISDWKLISRTQLIKNGAKELLDFYQNDFLLLLRSIYPNHTWNAIANDQLRYRPNRKTVTSPQFIRSKLLLAINTFSITKKKDWYRVPLRYEDISIIRSLKLRYAEEEWRAKMFVFRTKKISQRLVYSCARKIFPSFLIIEDYRHPHLTCHVNENHLEYDIFLPALQLAFEYQGEHHYDDLPSGFSNVELYRARDELKYQLATSHSVRLIFIPYWWNLQLESFISTIIREFPSAPMIIHI